MPAFIILLIQRQNRFYFEPYNVNRRPTYSSKENKMILPRPRVTKIGTIENDSSDSGHRFNSTRKCTQRLSTKCRRLNLHRPLCLEFKEEISNNLKCR